METKLPKLQELYSEKLEELKNQNTLNILLNQKPKDEWIKTHPVAKNVKYLTIQRIEFLLTSIFLKWKIEIKEVKLIANSIVTTIRLHYQDPLTKEWEWQDGLGGAPVHTSKGKGATDFDNILSDAVMKAAPASESFAIKDAAHKIGKLFGKDLIRNDEIIYDSLANKFENNDDKHKNLFDK